MRQIVLDMIPCGICPYCYVARNSSGESIEINLVYGGETYSLTGNENLSLEVRRPDNQVVTKTLNNSSGSKIVFTTTQEMTQCSGKAICNLSIAKNGVVLGTLNFIISVESVY